MYIDIFYKDHKLDLIEEPFTIRMSINLRSSKAIDLDKVFRQFKRQLRITEKHRKYLLKEEIKKENESTK
jgi:hypothetical protein